MKLPSISSYGNYSSENYGVHCLRVDLPQITVYFSYRTPVAFSTGKTGLVCRVNDWKQTTGKHLNIIEPNHRKRVAGDKFESMLAEACQV